MTRWMFFSTLATALFLGLYLLLFRRDRWLQLSRMYLLTTLAFSLSYPLLRMPTFELPLSPVDYYILPAIELTATPSIAENGVGTVDNKAESTYSALKGIYLLGAAIALAILLVQVARTALALRKMPSQGKHLHLIDDKTEPYSFFNHIVVGTKGLDDGQLQCILAHEELHVRQRHTLDVLLMRLMCCATWFNPFSYLYIRELRKVHEYQADDAVLATHGREAYLGLLYREATGFGYGHIKNKFQSINIKKRIKMMNKKKSRFGAWKLLAALPVAALVMAFGCRTVDSEVPNDTNSSTLLTVNYQRVGGKALPFGGIGYNKVCSHVNVENGFTIQVDCSDEGATRSTGAWEMSDLQTSKGLIDGRLLSRYERKLLKAIDKELRNGKETGTINRETKAKVCKDVYVPLLFTATWKNGKTNGDADITLKVNEMLDESLDITASEPPEFAGGVDSLYRYLAENIHYPEQAKKERIQGVVYIRFVVEADGSISNAEVKHGIGGGCDEEALRVVKTMPKWKPGTANGKPVQSHYNLPFTFKLNE